MGAAVVGAAVVGAAVVMAAVEGAAVEGAPVVGITGETPALHKLVLQHSTLQDRVVPLEVSFMVSQITEGKEQAADGKQSLVKLVSFVVVIVSSVRHNWSMRHSLVV